MSRCLPVAIVALGLGVVLTGLGCASTEDRQREARAADFNQWLGQDNKAGSDRSARQTTAPGHRLRVANSVNGAPMAIRCATAMTRTASHAIGRIRIVNWG